MIGVIDSGIGGLTVVDALLKRLPEEDLVYFGDTACARYGHRNPGRVVGWAAESAGSLRHLGATLLVLASHSISCLAFEELSRQHEVPVFDVATSAAEKAVEVSRRRRIGLVASRAVVESLRYPAMIRERCPEADVVTAACPLWAPLVEEGWVKRRETAMIVKRGLRPIRLRQVDTLILGSSFFTPLRKVIQRKMGSQVTLVEPVAELAGRVVAHLNAAAAAGCPSAGARRVRLVVSDLTPQVQRAAQAILGRPADLEPATREGQEATP
jgi:glutamate racemase